MKQEEVKDFYDQYTAQQQKTGINERMLSLLRRMKRYGLNSQSRVLELGCGIGSITRLISKTVKKGIIEAVDLSPRSIELLKARLSNKNITAVAGDITTYQPQNENFDFVTLFDVLEHIPLEQHAQLFANLSQIMTDESLLLINTPSPQHIEYDQKHHPEKLQIIDQPVYLHELMPHLSSNGLFLRFFELYSIWTVDDYQFVLISKRQEFTNQSLSEQRGLWGKIAHRIKLSLAR